MQGLGEIVTRLFMRIKVLIARSRFPRHSSRPGSHETPAFPPLLRVSRARRRGRRPDRPPSDRRPGTRRSGEARTLRLTGSNLRRAETAFSVTVIDQAELDARGDVASLDLCGIGSDRTLFNSRRRALHAISMAEKRRALPRREHQHHPAHAG